MTQLDASYPASNAYVGAAGRHGNPYMTQAAVKDRSGFFLRTPRGRILAGDQEAAVIGKDLSMIERDGRRQGGGVEQADLLPKDQRASIGKQILAVAATVK